MPQTQPARPLITGTPDPAHGVREVLTALLGYLWLADHPSFSMRRAHFAAAAMQQAMRLRRLLPGRLLLIVSREREHLREPLRALFGPDPAVEVVLDRRDPGRQERTPEERRRSSVDDELRLVGVAVGYPPLGRPVPPPIAAPDSR